MRHESIFYVMPRPGCIVGVTAVAAEASDAEFPQGPTDEDRKMAIEHLRTQMDLLQRAAEQLRRFDDTEAHRVADEIAMRYGR